MAWLIMRATLQNMFCLTRIRLVHLVPHQLTHNQLLEAPYGQRQFTTCIAMLAWPAATQRALPSVPGELLPPVLSRQMLCPCLNPTPTISHAAPPSTTTSERSHFKTRSSPKTSTGREAITPAISDSAESASAIACSPPSLVGSSTGTCSIIRKGIWKGVRPSVEAVRKVMTPGMTCGVAEV